MSIRQRLTEDMKEAMKAKDKASLSTIRMILAQIQRKEQDVKDSAIKRGEVYLPITEAEIVEVVQTFKKQTIEEMEAFGQRNDTDKVKELDNSLALISKYLPIQLTQEEISDIIKTAVEGLALNKGELMKLVMPLLKGKAGNKEIGIAVDLFLKG